MFCLRGLATKTHLITESGNSNCKTSPLKTCFTRLTTAPILRANGKHDMRPEALQPMQPVSGRELAAWGSKLVRRLWECIQWGKDSTDTYKQHTNAL